MMLSERLAEMRRQHVAHPRHGWCAFCLGTWPCEVLELVEAIGSQPHTCNSGHADWPLILWDCPTCVQQIVAERDRLLLAAAGAVGKTTREQEVAE